MSFATYLGSLSFGFRPETNPAPKFTGPVQFFDATVTVPDSGSQGGDQFREFPDGRRRLRESNFLVTIAPNIHVGEGDALITGAFKDALHELFSDNGLANCIKFGPSRMTGQRFRADTYSDHIDSVEASIGIEVGPVKRRLHAHVILRVTHYSQIQLDRGRMSDFIIWHMKQSGKMPNGWWERTPGNRAKFGWMKIDITLLPQKNLNEVLLQYVQGRKQGELKRKR